MMTGTFAADCFSLGIALLASFFMQRALPRLAPLPPVRKGTSRVLRCTALWLLFVVTFTLPSWIGDENPALLCPVFLVGVLLCTGGDTLGRLVLGGVFYALLIPINMIADSFVRGNGTLWKIHIVETVLPTLAKGGIWLVLAWVVARIAPSGGLRLAKRQWALLGGLTLAPLMSMLSLSLWSNHHVTSGDYDIYRETLERAALSMLPFVIVSGLALLFSAAYFTRQGALERELQLATLRAVYYDGVQQEQIQVRTLRHDLNNHLAVLQGLLARGEAQQALGYVQQLAQSPAFTGGARFCENEVANVVLSGKATAMQAHGLVADFSAALPEPLPLSAPELCALLGNALDNAMEAAQNADDKTILLRARADKGMLMLRVENAIGAPVRAAGQTQEMACTKGGQGASTRKRTGLFETTKANVQAHGFGLAGMRDIAERYGGTLAATAEQGRFILLVCVALPERL